MKTTLLSLCFLFALTCFPQAVIDGDTMLCPNGSGTAAISSGQVYDTYAWYYKYWFNTDDFQLIPGETGPSFTYDWATYDQALIKVVVTLGNESFESNTLQIDSYNWLPISTSFETTNNISINPENGDVRLCSGTTFTVSVSSPFNTNITWYREGFALPNANGTSLVISQPGTYYVQASPDVCPDNIGSTEGFPIVVIINNECSLGRASYDLSSLTLSPNPVRDSFVIDAPLQIDEISIFDMEGKCVYASAPHSTTSVENITKLASGIYIMEANSSSGTRRTKLVKQ